MVVIGAKGLAKELLAVLSWNESTDDIFFFDNIDSNAPDLLYGKFSVLKSWDALEKHFLLNNPKFILGVGGPKARLACSHKATSLGGKLESIISNQALVGAYGVKIGNGVCILSQATITADVEIGEGTLINKAAIISHDAKVGSYCEISPGVKVLGRARIGDRTELGTNAVILPHITIGDDCKVGAGAIVTKDVANGVTVLGMPAKPRL